MNLLQYALDRFRRMYVAEAGAESTGALVDYVVHNVAAKGSDVYELINWYEQRAVELRTANGLGAKPLPDDCTCTTEPCCPLHGIPRVPRAT